MEGIAAPEVRHEARANSARSASMPPASRYPQQASDPRKLIVEGFPENSPSTALRRGCGALVDAYAMADDKQGIQFMCGGPSSVATIRFADEGGANRVLPAARDVATFAYARGQRHVLSLKTDRPRHIRAVGKP